MQERRPVSSLVRWALLAVACGGLPALASAQGTQASSTQACAGPATVAVAAPQDGASTGPTTGAPAGQAQREEVPKKPSAFTMFVKDVAGDYKHFFRMETAYWYIGGFAASGLVHFADEDAAEAMFDPAPAVLTTLKGGDKYGNLTYQLPLAVGWWVTGHAMGSSRGADAGRDLVRAQISATSWAYVLKYTFNRERPNGDPRSFPSGHSTAAFATAMVLQEHYGWKVGVPFFAASTYTAISRLTVNKHWLSDVTMGAFVGMASARTVTLHVRDHRFALMPFAVPGGGGIAFTSVN